MNLHRSSENLKEMEKMHTSNFEDMEVEQTVRSTRLIFHDSVPKLVALAGFKLTIDLWSCSLQDPFDISENAFKTRIDNLLKELDTKISEWAKNSIIWYSKRVLKLSSMWATYHKERVFKDWDIELISGMCFPELIWRPDGSIDGFRSAEALIRSSNLGEEQEYKLVCLYCMENRIVDMWSRLVDDECVLLDVFFYEEISLLSYWNSRMAGYFSKSGMKSVENRLLANETIDNLSAAVYFFDRFTTEERVEKGCQLIPCVKLDERAEYVKTLLSKFDEEELHRAFQFHCSDLMYPLIMNRGYAKCASEFWDRVKNMLTIQSFLSIMTRITATLRIALKNPNVRFVDELDDYDDFKRHIFALVGDLWSVTPNSLKNHDLTASSRGVLYTLAECYVTMKIDWDPEARFLFIILPDADLKVSLRFMSKFFHKLTMLLRLGVVKDLVQVCDSVVSSDYFRIHLDVEYTKLYDMFRDKKFTELEEYLELCEPERRWKNFNKHMVLVRADAVDPVNFFIYPLEWNSEEIEQLREFITCVAENHPETVVEFRQKLYSYYPRLWPEPVEMDNDQFTCYSGLECSRL